MRALDLVLLLGLFLGPQSAIAQPKTVILLRHGEESVNSGVGLSSRGEKRAALLPDFFKSQVGPLEIAALYAQGIIKKASSKRSIESLKPTSKLFSIPINIKYEKGDGARLAADVMQNPLLKDKAAIIVWGSDEMGIIAKGLGAKFLTAAMNWEKSLFDRAWIFHYDDAGTLIRFEDVAQQLLKHDSSSALNSTIAFNPCDDTYRVTQP